MHVLLIDDDPGIRGVMRRILERRGHQVSESIDGLEAAARLAAGHQRWDLIICDVRMPRLGGFGLQERLQLRGIEMPILFVSGFVTELPDHLADASSRIGFLAKPFKTAELLAAIDAVLGGDRQPLR
jgi:DNA-binding response OmpR family regulator